MANDSQVLEFATINLKVGVKPNDERPMPVFRASLEKVVKSGGVNFRFLVSSPNNESLERPILGMTGIWPNDELHSAFLSSGALMPLLLGLGDLITVREVVYLQVPIITTAQNGLFDTDIVTALFHVNGQSRAAFGETTASLVESAPGCLAAWNTTAEARFGKAKDVCKDLMEPDQGEFQHGGTWSIHIQQADYELANTIKNETDGRFESSDVIEWNSFDV